MKTIRILAGVFLLALSLRGQQVTFPAAPAAPSVTALGTTGATSYYYWVSAHYPWGVSIPNGPGFITNGNATLTGVNLNSVSWTAMPYAVSYDLLRTGSSTPPTAGCNCALTTGTTLTTYNDIGAPFLAYTVATPGIIFPDASAQATAAAGTSGGPTIIKLTEIDDTAYSLAVMKFVGVASAVNQLTLTNAATGNGVVLATTGTDGTVPVTLNSKGASAVTVAPGAAGGTIVIGSTTQTGTITVGSSSGAEGVLVANGAGAPTVSIANVSTAGATVSIAGGATANGNTDSIAIAGGNTAGTGAKTVTIAGGVPAGSGADTVNIATGNAASTSAKKVNIATGTPATSGNNQVTLGGGATSAVTTNAVLRAYQTENWQATEGGANNAITFNLTDAGGNNVTLAAGLRVVVKLAHSLQAGANTAAINGGSTKSILSHNNPGNNIAAAYVSGGVIDMLYDGTQWLDLSQ